ncbi:hypothetical protein D5S18_28390 [Nocardia panacis]|uniref:Outer membrane channel protein CpnT-like N-terminal domain-containing protein n=1 Tax=Nocardia panacis TaxID=2340916 RepID=A0A3A4JM32_9NOCA|nr:hypothetical protein [Nocardia panacis]RJO69821.1 hypothetical protein D5S18_28390 [Nocardia panacis]
MKYCDAGDEFGAIAGTIAEVHGALLQTLNYCTGMAGSDNSGKQFVDTYDNAAHLAVSASSTLATACVETRNLILTGAYNHAVADANAHHSNAPQPDKPYLTPDPCLSTTVGSAADDDSDVPFGWSLVGDLIQYAWPNGKPGKLHAAANAWHNAATDYRSMTSGVARAIDLLGANRSDEIGTAVATCGQRQSDLNDLADACQTIGDACGDFANNLEAAQHQILDELGDLLAQTAGFEVLFAALAPLTETASEWVGNTAIAGRVTATASRIAEIIGSFVTRAGEFIASRVGPILGRLKPLLERLQKWVEEAKTKLAKFGKDDEPPGSNPSNTPGNPEFDKRIEELAKDPAKNGKISPQSRREAAVGLSAERDGLIPGPITRAQPGPNNEDMGEFVDADGSRWDVKSSPDVRPSYRPGAGTPLPNPQSEQDFVTMVESSLNHGEGVLLDPDGMTPGRLAQVQSLVHANPQWQGKVIWTR